MTATVGRALREEMSRVRLLLAKHHSDKTSAGMLAVFRIEQALRNAEQALITGLVEPMHEAIEQLKEF